MDTVDEHYVSSDRVTKEVDISRTIQFLTMDVITHLLFGEPFGYVRTQSDIHDFLNIVQERLPVVETFSVLTELLSLLWLMSYIPWLKLLIPNHKDESGIGRVMRVGPS